MSRRIAMISDHASPLAVLGGVDAGGQNVYVSHVARRLAAAGDRVDVFTRRDDPDLPEIVPLAPGVRVIHVPAGPPEPIPKEDLLPSMDAFTAWMRRRLRGSRGYDVVHANFFLSGLVAAELKTALGTPFVITFHALGRVRRQFQGDADRFPEERFAIEDRIVAEADRIVAECPQDEEDLIRLYNADPARISIVPCGFDPAELAPMSRPLARLELGLDPTERILLQLGRMVPRKGVDTAIRAVARLEAEHGIRARLLIVGGPDRVPDLAAAPELGRLAAIAREEGVEDRVTFVGRRDREELGLYYNAADIFVSTPWYEPFGITPLEAMACGTPVIGSAVGGIKFSVRDGETGYLVPPNDPSAVAERVAHLYSHPKLLSVLGRQAVRRVRDLFTWERVANGLAAVFEEVLLDDRLARTDAGEGLATIDRRFDDAIEVLAQARRRLRASVLEAADEVCRAVAHDGTVLVAGIGASQLDAQRMVAALLGPGRSGGGASPGRLERPGLRALALGGAAPAATPSTTADGLARDVAALGRSGDLLVLFAPSGRSPELVAAVGAARARGVRSLAVLGVDGGDLEHAADRVVLVPSADPQGIQEAHAVIVHLLVELTETRLSAAGWFAPREAAPSARAAPQTTDEALAVGVEANR